MATSSGAAARRLSAISWVFAERELVPATAAEVRASWSNNIPAVSPTAEGQTKGRTTVGITVCPYRNRVTVPIRVVSGPETASRMRPLPR